VRCVASLTQILACIGEAFEEEEEVCGCVVSIRKAQDRIAIWTRTASKEAAVRSIGYAFYLPFIRAVVLCFWCCCV
jgi:hypothetical protein